eukprot:CAMPEP_0117025880 /NCGR_PEP_ID=MMETSP0472-20121206/19074_1 /TAXON_ID=693140 ORGANISM="Tiarina fusus, Strain LIS" /NCGR_SAMPLE_ID=MMETSP0472 /ASSEMBLY_ACC=CAM_ASM_000603 /LENGTH=372 /DNA_ID=CAMNT_0004732719 /DNA_START=163 /DNA_END=1281 /DNA_ORIENTATION=+
MHLLSVLVFAIGTLSTTQAGLRGTSPSVEMDDQKIRRLDLQSFGGNPTNRYPLNRCEGDCDNDGQCKNNLICFQRKEYELVPGCSGGMQDGSRTDYCINPDDLNSPDTPQPMPSPTPQPVAPAPTGNSGGRPDLQSFGASPPGNRFPLGECEGDCDSDSDCASGLKCFMRDNFDPVPGCNGFDASRTDYCVKRNPSSPTPPSPTPPSPTPPSPTPPSPTPAAGLSDFRLKLYWEFGYFWQEETFEREWCMQCRNNGCNYGNKIYITACSGNNQRFDFVPVDNTYILIQLHGTNLCFERDFKDIFLFNCDASNDRQLWFEKAGSFSGSRFEISPKTLSNHCITQRHHPKEDEEVELEPCSQARDGETSYWNRY